VIAVATYPGRSAARNDALPNRDGCVLRACDDPGSAPHRYRAAPPSGKRRV
jgi:hypothetical protein